MLDRRSEFTQHAAINSGIARRSLNFEKHFIFNSIKFRLIFWMERRPSLFRLSTFAPVIYSEWIECRQNKCAINNLLSHTNALRSTGDDSEFVLRRSRFSVVFSCFSLLFIGPALNYNRRAVNICPMENLHRSTRFVKVQNHKFLAILSNGC